MLTSAECAERAKGDLPAHQLQWQRSIQIYREMRAVRKSKVGRLEGSRGTDLGYVPIERR
jgi:hypothetical protein